MNSGLVVLVGLSRGGEQVGVRNLKKRIKDVTFGVTVRNVKFILTSPAAAAAGEAAEAARKAEMRPGLAAA